MDERRALARRHVEWGLGIAVATLKREKSYYRCLKVFEYDLAELERRSEQLK